MLGQDEGKQNISAEDNSVAVESISVGGNAGDIHIGNVKGYTVGEEDTELFFGQENLSLTLNCDTRLK